MDQAIANDNVSRMRAADTTPDAHVSAAMTHIATWSPKASAVTPAITAPTAYPRSRQRRYTPTADARHEGWATSPMAASKVGYTIAVPIPSNTAPATNPANACATVTTAMPMA